MLCSLFARRDRLIDRLDLTGVDEAFRRKRAAKWQAVSDELPLEASPQLERKEKA